MAKKTQIGWRKICDEAPGLDPSSRQICAANDARPRRCLESTAGTALLSRLGRRHPLCNMRGVHSFRYAPALLFLTACAGDVRREPMVPNLGDAQPLYASEVVIPRVLEGLPVGPADSKGRPTVAPCGTCHLPGETKRLPTSADGILGPHRGLSVTHGELVCAACHAPDARDRLRMADARTIPLSSAMELCAQCHGTQKRDYDHGAHGGMRGHWDLTRGPRERNHCVACHDPHAPKFGHFMPVEGPRDRFSGQTQGALHE